jgi:hypothetical protein
MVVKLGGNRRARVRHELRDAESSSLTSDKLDERQLSLFLYNLTKVDSTIDVKIHDVVVGGDRCGFKTA